MSSSSPDQQPKPKLAKSMEKLCVSGRSRLLTWRNFWGILMNSPLAPRVQSQIERLSVQQCCNFFVQLSRQVLSTEELATLQVLTSILYLLPDVTQGSQKARAGLLRRFFQLVPTLEPMTIHYFTQNLLTHFEPEPHLHRNINHVLNIASCIATRCASGKAVGVCLLWSIIYGCAHAAIQLHQYRDLSELHEILSQVCVARLSVDSFGVLLRSVATLLHFVLCGQGLKHFQNFGYPSFYFRIESKDVKHLVDWLKSALDLFAQRRPGALQRARYAAKKLQASLEYLEGRNAQWCLVCRDSQGLPLPDQTKSCVLSDVQPK